MSNTIVNGSIINRLLTKIDHLVLPVYARRLSKKGEEFIAENENEINERLMLIKNSFYLSINELNYSERKLMESRYKTLERKIYPELGLDKFYEARNEY